MIAVADFADPELARFLQEHLDDLTPTAPARRGQGIASRLLAHALDDACGRGVARVSLETGSMEFFSAARALYARAGFIECAPFGDYTDDPHSVFMTKSLGPNPDDPARLSA